MLNQYILERDQVLLSLDEQQIRDFYIKWQFAIPENPQVFWAQIHKAIIYIRSASIEQKKNSVIWLKENGFQPFISMKK